jgi:hypothetical protein
MTEFVFAMKCLISTIAIVVMMQLKISGVSIEDRAFHWFRRSPTSLYVQSVAAGGVYVLRNLSTSVKDGVAGTSNSFKQGAAEQATR